MSRARTACTDCALPFYSDVNESCPYCGAAGPTAATAAPGRERTTCSDCGLPHYGTDCPYCAAAEPAAEPDSEPETPPPVQRQRERRQSGDGNRTVAGRLLGAVRSLFGR